MGATTHSCYCPFVLVPEADPLKMVEPNIQSGQVGLMQGPGSSVYMRTILGS